VLAIDRRVDTQLSQPCVNPTCCITSSKKGQATEWKAREMSTLSSKL
jgi:hypothetical protein